MLDVVERRADDRETAARFAAFALPPDLEADLRVFLQRVPYPLAVRSSSR